MLSQSVGGEAEGEQQHQRLPVQHQGERRANSGINQPRKSANRRCEKPHKYYLFSEN